MRTNKLLLVLAAWTSIVSVTQLAQADYIPPGQVEVKTAYYEPEKHDFNYGTYRYQVAWQGIPVAEAEVEIAPKNLDANAYVNVKASAKTGDFIDYFYRLRHTSESTFSASSYKPIEFKTLQTENSKFKRCEVNFDADGKISAVLEKEGDAREPVEFYSTNQTLDPISAAFVARSLPITTGTEAAFDVFNGKHRYLITFKVHEKEKIKIAGQEREAFKVVPTVKKLTDSDGEKRLHYASIWIAADSSREVLKLESKVLVGKVTAKMIGFTPSKDHMHGVRARLQ